MARKADHPYGDIIGFFEFMPCMLTVTPVAGKSRLSGEGKGAGGITELPSIISRSFLCSLWMNFTMSITNEMVHFLHKASMGCQHLLSWSQEEHGETNNLRDLPKSKDSPSRWLVHEVHHPTTTTEQFWRPDKGMLVFYCCHIPPPSFLSSQLNIASVKAQLRWPWVAIRNWGLKIGDRKCAYFSFFWEGVSLQRTFHKPECVFYYGLHQQADLGDFCLCVFLLLIFFGGDVCVCLSWPLFPLEKRDSKTHLKIYTHSVRSPVHSSEDAPAVLGKMPRNMQGCVNHNFLFPRCACCHIWKLWFLCSMWLTQNLHLLDTSIDFLSLWVAVMDGVATKSSAGQVVRVSKLRGAVSNVSQWLLRRQGCRFRCWSLADTWPVGCNVLLKKWNLPKLFVRGLWHIAIGSLMLGLP